MTAPTPEQLRVLADGRRTWPFHIYWDDAMMHALRAAADEVDRFCTVIENAPHGDECWLREDSDDGVLPGYRKCTCWKADV